MVSGAISLLIGLVPVLLFLAALLLLDSYKLVRRRAIWTSIGSGVLAALACFVANKGLLDLGHVDPSILKRYMAPFLEETGKALFVLMLIRAHRVGFLVDAGIHGFAVGTGFALIENVYYVGALHDFSIPVWVVRGLGTAMMHGGTTAMFGIIGKGVAERRGSTALRLFLPGLAAVVLLHSLFNHFALNPLLQTVLPLAGMPLLLAVIFERSERATRDWLGMGMDRDVEMLEQILSGEVVHTRVGGYLHSLRTHFSGSVVADMLCYLRIHLELSLRAKGALMARAAGFELPADPAVRANFEELKYLERSIGRTGLLAILPFLHTSKRDLWQLHVLRS